MDTVIVGVDVGQKRDPTALVVTQCQTRPGPTVTYPPVVAAGVRVREGYSAAISETFYAVRRLERLPLGTPYPQVAARLLAVVDGLFARFPRLDLVVRIDATGVGTPVVDLVRPHLAARELLLTACTFVHGERFTYGRTAGGHRDDGRASVGKAYLVSRLQALLQSARLGLPPTAEAAACAQELTVYEIRVDADGADTYGAFRTGAHDDLVTALGLTVLDDPSEVQVQDMEALFA